MTTHDSGQQGDGDERIIRVNGVDLCVGAFGDPADPAIVLIHGAANSMLFWRSEFCTRLADGGRFVLRYDLRDAGRSVTYEPGAPQYNLRDLADDVTGLLNAFGITSGHLVGLSLGGVIAQLVALDHADRVGSLTLVSTSPAPGADDLPAPPEGALPDIAPPDWNDRQATIEYIVESERPCAGAGYPFDEAEMRSVVEQAYDRTRSMEATMTNHYVVLGQIFTGEVEPWRDRLGKLTTPTLVIHGSDDPVFPHGHAVALAEEIPGATLLTLEGAGHELPRGTWDIVVPAILRHTSGH